MNGGRPAPRKRLAYERKIFLLALAVGAPGGIVAMALLWAGEHSPKVQWTLTLFVVAFWWGLAFSLRNRVVMPLQTLSNLLAALREGDFSIRARGARREGVHGDVMLEMNSLTATLRDQRMDALEATTLLRTIMGEIDVAIFAFDPDRKLRLVNRAGERLLGQPSERVLGLTAEELGLDDCLVGPEQRVLEQAFPRSPGRWEVRRTPFRQGGLPFQLLVLADVSRAMRQEERQTWQRLIRVLSHELNNSLTPIQSIAGSLDSLMRRTERAPDWEDDMRSGLGVISKRSESLVRFLDSYARLARLPEPKLSAMELAPMIRRVVGLETRMPIELDEGDEVEIEADGDQLEQLLINVIRNAVDAVSTTGGSVRVGWRLDGDQVKVRVTDEGPGLPNTDNLFVPFFSTKPGGSGIGLVLCRQIAEGHHGSLTISNREDRTGCEALLCLPAGQKKGADLFCRELRQ